MIEDILKEIDNIEFNEDDVRQAAHVGQWGDSDFFYYGIAKAMEIVEKYLNKEYE